MSFKGEFDKFLDELPKSRFRDPLTTFPPASERQLSACLAVAHSTGAMDWSRVALHRPSSNKVEMVLCVDPTDFVYCEYPLFARDNERSDRHGRRTGSTIDRWGEMSADLIFIGRNQSRITMLECKLNSEFTHSNRPPDGQLSRYIEYLEFVKGTGTANLILVCPECSRDWYEVRLQEAVKYHQSASSTAIEVFLTTWDGSGGIFSALTSSTTSVSP